MTTEPTWDLSTDDGRTAYLKHCRATIRYPYAIVGYGPEHVEAYRVAIAAELGIDGSRLRFTQTHPYGFDIALDGAELTLTIDQGDSVWRRLVEMGAVSE